MEFSDLKVPKQLEVVLLEKAINDLICREIKSAEERGDNGAADYYLNISCKFGFMCRHFKVPTDEISQ